MLRDAPDTPFSSCAIVLNASVHVVCGVEAGAGRDDIIRIVSDEFPSFTMIEGEGFFRGQPEPSWMVKIASDDGPKVIRTAERIREALDQDGVGIELKGEYHRCTSQQCAAELANSFVP